MPNDSSTGGYLAPSGTNLDGQDLEDLIQSAVAQIVGLPGAVVFPRWQDEPPNIPANGVDWAAVGITEEDPDPYPSIIHHPDGDGYDELRTQQNLSLLASFYGPNARRNARFLANGLFLPQNLEAFNAVGIGMVDIGVRVTVPSLIKSRWWQRIDQPFRLRQATVRTYPVLNLLSAVGTIMSDDGLSVTFDTQRSE